MNKLSNPQSLILKAAASVLSPAGSKASLLVLIYHRVVAERDALFPDEPTVQDFAAAMDLVGNLFNVLKLSEAIERLRSNSLPARAACITFDDGYRNNHDCALPVLAARRLPATFFIATGFIGQGRMWNDTVIEAVRNSRDALDLSTLGLGRFEFSDPAARRRAVDALLGKLKYLGPTERFETVAKIAQQVDGVLPEQLMMSADQIRALARHGMEIGAHTVTHPILTRIDPAAAKREMGDSKERLEEILGERVTTFAFPNGRPNQDYAREHVGMVRDLGFKCAVSTAWGRARADGDVFQIPRIAPWDKTAFRYGARMLASYVGRKAQIV